MYVSFTRSQAMEKRNSWRNVANKPASKTNGKSFNPDKPWRTTAVTIYKENP